MAASIGQDGITLKQPLKEAIKAIYEGRDAFVWLPTGYGKSLCYQCLPYLLDYKLGKVNSAAVNQSIVMVVSPLVSGKYGLAREYGYCVEVYGKLS